MKRRLALIPAAVLLAATLTSCASGGGDTAESSATGECAPEGSISKEITVDGEFGSDVTLASETPIEIDSTERSVLISGEGSEITEDDLVLTRLNVFNGTDGSLVITEGAALQLGDTVAPWVHDAMNCSNVGDRTVTVLPATDVFGEGQVEATGLPDLAEDDTLVIVLDFQERLLERAEGTELTPPDEAPSVDLDDAGAPTITMPEGVDAPEELTIHTLIEGDGTEVQDGDRVYVHYRGIIWRTGEEFDSSWSRGAPTDFVTTGVIGGFKDALVGQTVGSQVMSIVPAEDGGYGADALTEMGHESDDVMVFVLDILGTVPAAQ